MKAAVALNPLAVVGVGQLAKPGVGTGEVLVDA